MPRAAAQSLTIVPVSAFRDNYIWLLHRGGRAAIVDPGDAVPVEAALSDLGLELDAIVLTHHHPDHTGGVIALRDARPNHQLAIYGPQKESIPGVTHPMTDGASMTVAGIDLPCVVIEVAGHTRGHIAYYAEEMGGRYLFCGDTLFGCGCGRLFEGTAEQMQHSLARLAGLPGDTLCYCGHEYTMSNIRFALAVDPENKNLQERSVRDQKKRDADLPTVPFTMAQECATNPFLRWDAQAVREAAHRKNPEATTRPADIFGAIRAWKDRF